MRLLLLVYILLGCVYGYAQKPLDSIQRLDEVVLSDVKLKRFANGYKLIVLNDSVLKKNTTSLTDVLRFNSSIYFKENGYGMVSSPSFRGTNASQTGVIWNGININSILNGQVDFNIISSVNYDNVTIRNSGGSVQYGSGAIGGTVHLSNELDFSEHTDHTLRVGYGSFNTFNTNYNFSFGKEKWSGNFGVAYVDSENDYEFIGLDRRNENGQFNNLDINLNLGYTLSDKDVLKLYHQNFRSDRNLSATIVAPSNSRYESEDYRTMIDWVHSEKSYKSVLKAAHLSEQFKYFENKDLDIFSKGQATTWYLKHNYERKLTNSITTTVLTDYTTITAEGNSFDNPKRDAFSTTVIFSHQPNNKLAYNLNLRKDFISDFESPFVFSGDLSYELTKNYTVKLNASKNFRVPTFNDLYWTPGGNLDLNPEESYQIDLGHSFTTKLVEFDINTFYIETSDLIQWRPDSSLGYWLPINIASTKHYGLEADLRFKKEFNNHKLLLVGSYSYTETEDVERQEPLIYVPIHKANLSASYNYKSFSAIYQHLFNGEVNIIGNTLKEFQVANIGLSYNFKSNSKLDYTVDLNINNIYNTYYENVALRPMPNRNLNMRLTLNF